MNISSSSQPKVFPGPLKRETVLRTKPLRKQAREATDELYQLLRDPFPSWPISDDEHPVITTTSSRITYQPLQVNIGSQRRLGDINLCI